MRKLLLFLLLLALGAAALRLAIGDDDVVTAGNGDTPQPKQGKAEDRTPGIVVNQGRVGAEIATTGHFKWPRYRAVKGPDGTVRDETVLVIEAADSRPVREGLQELEDVVVTLFDRQQEAAVLHAARAFVELTADANGQPSLREDKDIDMRQVVFETLPGSRLEGLRLELDNARLQIGDDEVLLHTPNPGDPVTLVLAGNRSGRLTGKGLQARLPRDRNGKLQRTDVTVLSDPLVVTDGMQLRARGRLHYQEDTNTGAAQLSAEDTVEATFDPRQGVAIEGKKLEATTVQVFGDRFDGWLQRGKAADENGEEHEQMQWQVLQVTGAPARVAAPDTDLSAPRLTVLPGLSGQPYMLAAHGGECRVEQRQLDPRTGLTEPLVGVSPRRIHLILPAEQTAALHRSFGFPLWTLRPIATTRVVTFDGDSRITSGGSQVRAAEGLHMFVPDARRQAVTARGFGEVTIDRPATKPGEDALHAHGNDGLVLIADEDGQHGWLGPVGGPAERLAQHRYELKSGEGELRGSGSCEIVRTTSGTRVVLDSAAGDIEGNLPRAGAELRQMRHLTAHLTEESLRNLVATGAPMLVTFTRGDETLQAKADRIEQLGPTSWVLLPTADGSGALPELQRLVPATATKGREQVAVHAPRIELHHCGGSDWLIDLLADGDVLARADAELERARGGPPTVIAIEARRLRLLPFVVTREALQAHAGHGVFASLLGNSVGHAWILGDDVQRIHTTDPEQGEIDGRGRRLVLSQGARAAVLFGDDQTLEPAWLQRQLDGKTVVARGAQVRIFRDEQVRLQALRAFPGRSVWLTPVVTLHQPQSQGALGHITATCQGDIDVLPERIEFGGPVIADSVREDGSTDPEGLHIDARVLQIQRHAKTGEIVLVRGRDVTVEWAGIWAKSAEIELDLKWSKCIARDPNDAEVRLPGGQRFVAPAIEILYDRMEVRCHQGRFTRADKDTTTPR
ncbi:MAG: hypothetical protein H6838_03140 [Planctomycetes bacterium]|nr:hypothetical protein [Planctomycetota bacterium]MCB9884457.1 hypothetical protein [Planctomycetota bacterium]